MPDLTPPPELAAGQDGPPDIHQLLVVVLGLVRQHIRREPIDPLRWLAIRAVLERVLDDDSS